MSAPRLIQLDCAFVYQQAAISAVLRALAQTHGADFSADFVREHRAAILAATRTRLRDRDAYTVMGEAMNLSLAYMGA